MHTQKFETGDGMEPGEPDADGVKIRSALPALTLAILAYFADGFDLGVMGFIVPELVKTWHVAPAELVPVLSAQVFGLMVGALLLGYLGDRMSRKAGMLICLTIVGCFSLLTMFAADLRQLIVLRFLTGMGLGGLGPVVLALAAEIAPKRFRGLFMVIIQFGVPAGLVIPGWTAALLVPRYGWTSLLLVGGVLPLAVAALSYAMMREAPSARAEAPGEPDRNRPAPFRTLFAGRFAVITPMFWLLFAANQFTNFFVLSWLPTLLQSAGLSTAQAAIKASLYASGGIVGGLVLTVTIDRFGSIPVLILFLLGAPAAAAIGLVDPSTIMLAAAVAACGFCVTGNNFATNALVGMIYPARVRSLASGAAHAFGRLGALMAQLIGGLLFAHHVSMQGMYLTPATMLLVGAAASLVLTVACRPRPARPQPGAAESNSVESLADSGPESRVARLAGPVALENVDRAL
ncbi:MFS transporter [Bradyrhizobium elkanii]|uniref:MFS transporter n=1 Tax=Bradyrhizobium elkanii TaxID=29448 RepID=UPI00056FEAB8|nr:MFS transporter [Bradyrhizobium elkanii]